MSKKNQNQTTSNISSTKTNVEPCNLIKYVFLDTNIFSSAKFNYRNGNLHNFLKNAMDYSIKVYITSVTKIEIMNKIRDFSKKHHESISNAISSGIAYSQIENKEECFSLDKFRDTLLKFFEDAIDDYEIKILPCSLSENDTNLIMEMHYNKKPPFCPDKQNEFKDTISLINILNFIKKEKVLKNAIFVSQDNDCILFCQENNMKYCNHISKISHIILSQNDHNQFIKNNREIILKYLQEHFKNKKIDYEILCNLWNSENLVDIREEETIINNIELINYYINSIENENDENDTIKVIDISVDIKLDLTFKTYPYGDDETAFDDKEDNVLIYWRYIETTFNEVIVSENKNFSIFYSLKENKIVDIEQQDLIEVNIEGYIGDYRYNEGSVDHVIEDEDL